MIVGIEQPASKSALTPNIAAVKEKAAPAATATAAVCSVTMHGGDSRTVNVSVVIILHAVTALYNVVVVYQKQTSAAGRATTSSSPRTNRRRRKPMNNEVAAKRPSPSPIEPIDGKTAKSHETPENAIDEESLSQSMYL